METTNAKDNKKFTPISEDVKANITTVFKSFDKDNSNSIDMKEIKLVAKELGQDINDEEIKQIFGDIDTNKDNKISFNEFYNWWCYGKINKMERLVYYKLKALNLLEKSKGLQSRMGKVLSDKYEPQVDSFHFGLKFGQYEPKTKLGLRFSAGKASNKAFEALASGLEVNSHFTIILKIRASHDPKGAEASLNQLIENLKKGPDEEGAEEKGIAAELGPLMGLLDFKVKSDDKFIYLAITTHQEFITDLVESFLKVPTQNLSEEFDSNIGFTLTVKNDFSALLNDYSTEKLVVSLLEGFSLTIDGALNSDFTKNARKELLASVEQAGQNIPQEIKNLVILSLVKGIKADIQLKELEKKKLEQFLKTIGSFQALQGTPSFIEILDLLKKIRISALLQKHPLVNDIVLFIRSHCKAQVEVHIKAPKVLCTLEFETTGLKECYDYLLDRNE